MRPRTEIHFDTLGQARDYVLAKSALRGSEMRSDNPLTPLELSSARARGDFIWQSSNDNRRFYTVDRMDDQHLLNAERWLRKRHGSKVNEDINLSYARHCLLQEIARRGLIPHDSGMGVMD